MWKPGILDRYVGRRFLGLYGICLLFFVMLFLVVDGVTRIDDFLEARDDLAEGVSLVALAIEYYLSRIPVFSVLFAPYLTLFAAIACLMTFTRHHELTAMISAGRSLHRVLAPVYIAAVVITGLLLIAEEDVVPGSLRRLQAVERKLEGKKTAKGERVPHLRDGTNTFVADRWFVDDLRLSNVRCLSYSDASGDLPEGQLVADALIFRYRESDELEAWFPVRGELRPSGTDAEGRLLEPILLPPDEPVALGLSPTKVEVLVEEDVASLPSAQIRELRDLYPDKFAALSMQLYSRRTRPIASFVLLLLGLPFVARPGQRSIAAGLAVAFGCCLVYMTFDLFCSELGARGEFHPLIASWFTPSLFFAIGVARIDKVVT
jgi:lipopolysaccharide export system permease protein